MSVNAWARIPIEIVRPILEEPHRDEVRMTCVHWLEQHDTPDNFFAARAEFIRLQLMLAAGNSQPPTSRFEQPSGMVVPEKHSAALAEVGMLLKLYGELWFPDRTRFAPILWRGFYAQVDCPWRDLEAGGRDLFSNHPITTVELLDYRPVEIAAGQWGWPSELPEPLGQWMDSGTTFSTRGAAAGAISSAAVNYGRVLAGLSPLREPSPSAEFGIEVCPLERSSPPSNRSS